MRSNPPDLVLRNAKVITLDARSSLAEAFAVSEGRIVAVGGDDEIGALAGARTTVVNARGRAVIPGLVDGHAHLDREGMKSTLPSLAGARSIRDVLDRIEALVRQAPGEWIVTNPLGDPPEYDALPDLLREKRFPNRWDLDEVAPDSPVYIRPIWGYWRRSPPLVSIANSRALELAGITRDTPSPSPSVEIEKDPATGEPTGIFREWTDMPIVELSLLRACPGFSRADRVAGLRRSLAAYHATGTTSAFEGHGVASEVIDAYRVLNATGGLTMRSELVFSPAWEAVGAPPSEQLVQSWLGWLAGRGVSDGLLRISGFYAQIATDEGFRCEAENRLRAQAAPRTGWAGFHYDCGLRRSRLKEVLIAAARNDVRAVGLWPGLLDLYEEVDRVAPIRDKRWVLGHIGMLGSEEIRRIRDLGLVLVLHPNKNIYRIGHELRRRLGPERENEIVPARTLLDAGIPFALSTDNCPPSMFYPVWECVARRARETGEAVGPDQRLTREEALRAATLGGAYLCGSESDIGSIEAGKLADFAVLSADPLEVPEDAIKDLTADLTFVAGRLVYAREGAETKEIGGGRSNGAGMP